MGHLVMIPGVVGIVVLGIWFSLPWEIISAIVVLIFALLYAVHGFGRRRQAIKCLVSRELNQFMERDIYRKELDVWLARKTLVVVQDGIQWETPHRKDLVGKAKITDLEVTEEHAFILTRGQKKQETRLLFAIPTTAFESRGDLTEFVGAVRSLIKSEQKQEDEGG